MKYAYILNMYYGPHLLSHFANALKVTRVRNALAYATHKFFQENGFVWVSSPIITASDCEGAGEQFCVTTLVCTLA